MCWKLDSVPLPLDVIKPKVVKESLQWSGERKCNVTWIKPNWQADWTYNAITSLLSNDTFVRRTSDLEKTANMSWLRTQKIFTRRFHSVAYGCHLYLVCAVCDVTTWCHIHVSNPTFSRNVDTICMFFYMHSPLLNLCATALNINYQHSRLRYQRKIHSTVRHSSS